MPANKTKDEPTSAQIQAQRDRILASRQFSLSKRQCAFLDFVVNESLAGRADKLKEFTLAVEVFDRDESFDPRIDSIVRVEASRLRGKLREYYAAGGDDDVVKIDIPKGHYVPVFCLTRAPASERGLTPNRYIVAGLIAVAAIIAGFYALTGTPPAGFEQRDATQQLPPPPSLAVLPLRNWSSAPDEYLGVAMTDALISSLAEIRALRVTSLTSVMKFRDTETAIPEIGRALGVAYIVEGSITRDDENVRITTQLISANEDKHIWSQTFDRPTLDLLPMQSEVAAAIATQISDELLPETSSRSGNVNSTAYEAFLKGRYFYNQFTAEGFRRSMRFFQEAIDIEPEYADAYAGLASCHCLLAGHGLELVSPVVAIPEAHSLATKALSLDSEMAEPTAFLGIIAFKFHWDPAGAEARLSRAIELNPSLFQAYLWHSQVLEGLERHEDAVSRARYAKRLNPLSLAASLNLGWQLFQAGKYIEADAEIDGLIEFDPEFWGGHWVKGHIHNQHKLHQNAIDAFQRAIDLGGGHSLPISALGYTFAVAGRHDDARRILQDLERLSMDVYVSPFHVATVYAGLGDADAMFEWLGRAYEVRARSLAWLHVTREFDPYGDDDRLRELLKRIGIWDEA